LTFFPQSRWVLKIGYVFWMRSGCIFSDECESEFTTLLTRITKFLVNFVTFVLFHLAAKYLRPLFNLSLRGSHISLLRQSSFILISFGSVIPAIKSFPDPIFRFFFYCKILWNGRFIFYYLKPIDSSQRKKIIIKFSEKNHVTSDCILVHVLNSDPGLGTSRNAYLQPFRKYYCVVSAVGLIHNTCFCRFIVHGFWIFPSRPYYCLKKMTCFRQGCSLHRAYTACPQKYCQLPDE